MSGTDNSHVRHKMISRVPKSVKFQKGACIRILRSKSKSPVKLVTVDMGNLVGTPGFLFKIGELVLCIIGFVLLIEFEAFRSQMEWMMFIVALPSTIGYLYIITTYIFIYIFNETNSILEIMQLTIGGVLNLWAGVQMNVNYFSTKNMPKASLFLSVECTICGIVMIIDAVREFRLMKKRKQNASEN